MTAALAAFLTHPEAGGMVARTLEATEGFPTSERARAILTELMKMTDRDWSPEVSG